VRGRVGMCLGERRRRDTERRSEREEERERGRGSARVCDIDVALTLNGDTTL